MGVHGVLRILCRGLGSGRSFSDGRAGWLPSSLILLGAERLLLWSFVSATLLQSMLVDSSWLSGLKGSIKDTLCLVCAETHLLVRDASHGPFYIVNPWAV